eukprot:6177195-Prymnesium_polylepis.1
MLAKNHVESRPRDDPGVPRPSPGDACEGGASPHSPVAGARRPRSALAPRAPRPAAATTPPARPGA